MDEARAREILDAVGQSLPGALLLWRGAGLDGSDVDVVVAPGHDAAIARALREAGLAPAPQDPGHVRWRLLPGEIVVIDALASHGWPKMYPLLKGVLARSARFPNGLAVAAPGDRLLIHASEAVAGWSIEKVLRNVRRALVEPGARTSLGAYKATASFKHLTALVENPDRLEATARDGRLPLRAALAAGLRSVPGRHALLSRAKAWVGLPSRPPLPPVRERGDISPGLVVALSGMDGAGKSTAALELAATLEEMGRPTAILWTRLAGDPYLLDLVARPVRRLLGRPLGMTMSQPTPHTRARSDAGAVPRGKVALGTGPRRLVDGVWIALVALETVRASRRALNLRRRGVSVVCDRWAADALVDLRVRYGRHRLAEWLMTHGIPRPDLLLYLEVDPPTANARKPGDQPLAVLEAMAALYDQTVGEQGVVRLDANAEHATVIARARASLHAALTAGGQRPLPG